MSSLEAFPAPAPRPDTWAAGNVHCCIRYQVLADAQPALLCQVLNLFAMQYLVPLEVTVSRHGDSLQIEVDVDGLSGHRAAVIGEKMRNLIDVESVQLQMLEHPTRVARTAVLVSA